jgi:hypothetical protein
MTDTIHKPCDNCPWRVCNHGKRTKWGFYTKSNLKRLWGQIRRAARGGIAQSCHPTDPSHPDHREAGAKTGSTPVECAGSVILVYRELQKLKDAAPGDIVDGTHIDAYLAQNKQHGLTKKGLLHWLIGRHQMGGTFFGTGPKLPNVDIDEPGVGRICDAP